MSNKIRPEAQGREAFAQAIKNAKRKFDAQNKGGVLSFEHEARFALEAAGRNPGLLNCDLDTVTDSIANLAAMQLSLNPASQQAALIPRWNSKKNALDCTASPQYRGLMKLATDTGVVNNITAEVVFECEEDTFDVDLGSNPYLKHKPKIFAGEAERKIDLVNLSANKAIGCYCIAHFKNSDKPHITVMDLQEILSVARASEAFNPRKPGKAAQGPWVYWPGEMIKKSVIRRATKQWPLSDDGGYQRLLKAVEIDNEAEANEQRAEVRSDQVEQEMGEPLTKGQVEIIKDLCKQQELAPAEVYQNYAVNSLSKIPQKFFGEIETKLLQRQQLWNARQAKKAAQQEAQSEVSEG